MKILLVIPHHFIASVIATACEHDGNTCIIISSLSDFFIIVENMNQETDLIVFDYLIFNHDSFNIYRYMKKINRRVPIIFYNDPFPQSGTRHIYWEAMLYNFHPDFFQAKRYRKILKLIASTVESEYLRQYVPLLQQPRPEPALQSEISKKTVSLQPQTELEYLGKYLQLSGTLFLLFEVLYKNRNTTINAAAIRAKMTKSGMPIKTATIYALVKRLREKLTASEKIQADIITTIGGYRLLLVENNEKEA